jgi:hypothetical protein
MYNGLLYNLNQHAHGKIKNKKEKISGVTYIPIYEIHNQIQQHPHNINERSQIPMQKVLMVDPIIENYSTDIHKIHEQLR